MTNTEKKRSGMKKSVFILVSLLVGFSVVELKANSYGTLVHTIGEVQLRKKGAADWLQPHIGTKLVTGDEIRTFVRSAALILNPDGSMIMVDEAAFHRYQLYAEGEQSALGFNILLSRYFNVDSAERYSPQRSTSSIQENWLRLMKKVRFSPGDLELSFEMINAYNKKGQWNRVSALLVKLKTVYPENPGFYQLSNQAFSGHLPIPNWRVTRISDGQKTELEDGSFLVPEDEVSIHYLKNDESYCFLFVTYELKSDQISTRMLFPGSITATKKIRGIAYFESRQARKEAFHFQVQPDKMKPFNKHHFWGWSCEGPVLNQTEISVAIRQIEQQLLMGKRLTKSLITLFTPDICRSSFARSLDFVEKLPLTLNDR